jgi:hypothetical protein
MLAEEWKTLPEKEKARYSDQYQQNLEKYQEDSASGDGKKRL